MFHFPGCPPTSLCIQLVVTGHYPSRVPPFGNLRILAYLQLPEAYRSLSRPSSAISAMASTLRSYSLDLLPNLHPTLLRLLRGQMKALVLSIVSCCFNSFLCSFQGAIVPVKELWWAEVDSNHRPHAYQACALTS